MVTVRKVAVRNVTARKMLYNILNNRMTFKNYVGRGPTALSKLDAGNKLELSKGQALFFDYFIKQIRKKCVEDATPSCSDLITAVETLKQHIYSAKKLDDIRYDGWRDNLGVTSNETQKIWNSFVILGNGEWKKRYIAPVAPVEPTIINWNEVWCIIQREKIIDAVGNYAGRIDPAALALFKKNIAIADEKVFDISKVELLTQKVGELKPPPTQPEPQRPNSTSTIRVPDKSLVKITTAFIKQNDGENIYEVKMSIKKGYDITIIPNQVVGVNVSQYLAGQTSTVENTLLDDGAEVITTIDTNIDDDDDSFIYNVNISIPKKYSIDIISEKTIGSNINDWLKQFTPAMQ